MVSDSLQYLTSLGSDVHGDKDLALEIAYAYVRVAHAQGDPTSPNLGQFAEAEASLDKAEDFVDAVLRVDPKNRRGLFIAATIAHDRMVLADEQNRRQDMVSWADKASERVERFVRLDQSRSLPGLGLGLSLASAVARLHGGELKLEDNHPGLRSIIALPRAGPAAGAG